MEIVIFIVGLTIVLVLLAVLAAVISVFWPLLLVLLVIWLLAVFFFQFETGIRWRIKMQERSAEFFRSIRRKIRDKKYGREAIRNAINDCFNTDKINFDELTQILSDAYASEEKLICSKMASRKQDVFKWILENIAEGDYHEALVKANLLYKLYPNDTEVNEYYRKSLEISVYSNNPVCYMVDNEYGEVNSVRLERIESARTESMNEKNGIGIALSLWSEALADSFDEMRFSSILQVARSVKTTYYKVSVDAMVAMIYVEHKHGKQTAEKIFRKYREELCDYIDHYADSVGLQNMASAMKWVGDIALEQRCLDASK